jgi:WD40 repeat protein
MYLQRQSARELRSAAFWAGAGCALIGISLLVLICVGFPSSLWNPQPLSWGSLFRAILGALGVFGLGVTVFFGSFLAINKDIDGAQKTDNPNLRLAINPSSSMQNSAGGLLAGYSIVLLCRHVYLVSALVASPAMPFIDAPHTSGASFSADGVHVALFQRGEPSATSEVVTVWTVQSRKRVLKLGGSSWGYPQKISIVTLSPDARMMAVGPRHPGAPMKIWDVKTEECVRELRLSDTAQPQERGDDEHVTSAAFSSDGSRLALADKHGIIIYDTASWCAVAQRQEPNDDAPLYRPYYGPWRLAFIDKDRALIFGFDGSLQALRTDDLAKTEPVTLTESINVVDFAISPDGLQIVVLKDEHSLGRGSKGGPREFVLMRITLNSIFAEGGPQLTSQKFTVTTHQDIKSPVVVFLPDGRPAMGALCLNGAGAPALLLHSGSKWSDLSYPSSMGKPVGLRAIPNSEQWLVWTRAVALVFSPPDDPHAVSP